VFHEVASDELQALLSPNHGLELRPLALELLSSLDLFTFGGLFKLGVNLRPLGFQQFKLRQPALVVDGHCRAIEDRALNVVNADVVAEHGARVCVRLLDRRACEADERRMWERVAHMPREAVDEVILAAVRLVGDDDDVAPLRKHRLPVTLLLGKEFLDCGEHHATRRDCECRTQVGAVRGQHRGPRQQLPTARKGTEELVVEIIAVGQHHNRRIGHRRVQSYSARVKRHG
jgi:hypothetical protein